MAGIAIACILLTLGVAVLITTTLRDSLILASFNATVNVLTLGLHTYLIQITHRLDKEVNDGGK